MNKRSELEKVITESSPKIIGITEILPKNCRYAVSTTELQIPGYELFTNVTDIAKGRGVCLYIEKSLKPTETVIEESDFEEAVWATITVKNKEKILIGCIYRSPNSTPDNNGKLNNIFKSLSRLGSDVLVMGDFNYPEVNWKDCTCTQDPDSEEYKFLESARDTFMYQMVSEPTRIHVDQTPNILDLVWTTDETLVDDLQHSSPLGASDHCSLLWNLNRATEKNITTSVKYLYDKGDYINMRNMLDQNWEDIFENKDVNTRWEILKTEIKHAQKICIPVSKVDVKRRKPVWWNNQMLMKVKKKHQAWNRYQNTKDGQDYLQYARARNQAKGAIRKSIKDFEKSVAQDIKRNPKKFWQYINSKVKSRGGVAELYKDDDTKTSSDLEKAEVLNECRSPK